VLPILEIIPWEDTSMIQISWLPDYATAANLRGGTVINDEDSFGKVR
jgi:hypothetical protein